MEKWQRSHQSKFGINRQNFTIGQNIHLPTLHLALRLMLTVDELKCHERFKCSSQGVGLAADTQNKFCLKYLSGCLFPGAFRAVTSERVQRPRKLGQTLSAALCTTSPVFPQSMWKSCTVLCCTRTTLTPTPAHANTSWHTY